MARWRLREMIAYRGVGEHEVRVVLVLVVLREIDPGFRGA